MVWPKRKGKELENKPQKQQNLHLQKPSFFKSENGQSHRITNILVQLVCVTYLWRDTNEMWVLCPWKNKDSITPLMALKFYAVQRKLVQTLTTVRVWFLESSWLCTSILLSCECVLRIWIKYFSPPYFWNQYLIHKYSPR